MPYIKLDVAGYAERRIRWEQLIGEHTHSYKQSMAIPMSKTRAMQSSCTSNETHCDYERAVMQVRVPVRQLKPVLRPTALHILLQCQQLQRTGTRLQGMARLKPPQHSSQMPMATSRAQRKRAKQRRSFSLLQTQVHCTKLRAKPQPLQK